MPARTKLEISVACVEQGRWEWSRRSLGAMAPAEALYPAARRAKAEAVTRSVRHDGAYDADQALVWQNVAHKLQSVGVASPTSAILDAYRQRDADLEAYARAFAWREVQAGVICGIGGAIACADLFDHPETLRLLYRRLVRSYALDAFWAEEAPDGADDAAAARQFAESGGAATMTVHPSVGLGQEVRLTAAGVVGAALVADGKLVHAALFRTPPVEEKEAPPLARPSRRGRGRA